MIILWSPRRRRRKTTSRDCPIQNTTRWYFANMKVPWSHQGGCTSNSKTPGMHGLMLLWTSALYSIDWCPYYFYFADASHMSRTKDLSKWVKTVLVRKLGVNVSEAVAKDYTKIEKMNPCAEKYCKVYFQDLIHCVGLSLRYLLWMYFWSSFWASVKDYSNRTISMAVVC